LRSSPNIIRQIKSRRMRWAGHVTCVGEERKMYRVLVGKSEGMKPLGRSKCRWEDEIKRDFRWIVCVCVRACVRVGGGIHLAQNSDLWRALVNTVINLWVPAPRS
jgi:hypothetical protein